MTSNRKYSVVVFGATGFTGKRVAMEVQRVCVAKSRNLKWAIAGRNESKLNKVSYFRYLTFIKSIR